MKAQADATLPGAAYLAVTCLSPTHSQWALQEMQPNLDGVPGAMATCLHLNPGSATYCATLQ